MEGNTHDFDTVMAVIKGNAYETSLRVEKAFTIVVVFHFIKLTKQNVIYV